MSLGLAHLSKATCQLLGKPKKMLKVTLATCIGKFPSSGMTIQVDSSCKELTIMNQPSLKQNSYYLWRSGSQRILGHTDMFQFVGGKVPYERMRTSPDKQLHRTQEDNLA